MSAHTKAHLTDPDPTYAIVLLDVPGKRRIEYKIPASAALELVEWLGSKSASAEEMTSWEECTPWKEVAADRIQKHGKAGLALRGARYREGISQKALAKRCGISQENLSKMENGKRTIGPQVAGKLAEALRIDPKLLMQEDIETL